MLLEEIPRCPCGHPLDEDGDCISCEKLDREKEEETEFALEIED